MEDIKSFFKNIYQDFNKRNMESVIDNMTDDVRWANGMEDGYIYGRAAVREYWKAIWFDQFKGYVIKD
ncbi:MAG TPA: nuclear transport factor 2 family protein [Parafilimonas sp.]|nr:nuclear transport factor 2 family protein [Parafilimonas sp.]